ncbi:uncharacterized protein LOC121388424 [Gigantopelta aegis]|uniref:uncharacterized protein LOC121388424 n=1 Tax=Gigantopelta aegis TaxID=1735272 RepID=UPI001B88BA29|nr:uncharacterized protein LOC121388424 [Gigantopelta aegis]
MGKNAFIMEDAVSEAVVALDADVLLSVLYDESCSHPAGELSGLPPFRTLEERLQHNKTLLPDNVFLAAVSGLVKTPKEFSRGARMIYLLRNLGANIGVQNEDGNNALMLYLKTGELHPDVIEAFLRCNADVYHANKNGEYPLEVITLCSDVPKHVKDVFMKYVPGIWEAVEGDDAMNVRKLINQWCRVDVEKNGKSLLQLTFDIGTESIIRVISGIRASMDFAHGVLAGDTMFVQKLLSLKKKININFRNLGDRGAPPLLYALQQGNADMVRILLSHNARVDLAMRGDGENDIPLYFVALASDPPIRADLLKMIVPTGPLTVDHLYYKGMNSLFHCIDQDVSPDVIEDILLKGSAYLVTQRIKNNICLRQYAYLQSCGHIADVIDRIVLKWIFQEDGKNRKILALHGYNYIPTPVSSAEEFIESQAEMSSQYAFYQMLPAYYTQIHHFHEAVDRCDFEAVKSLLFFTAKRSCLEHCLADSRTTGDGQPALHKAVLHGNYEITELLAETLVYQLKQRLDSVRDQSFRTALHYAYALEGGKELVNLLLDYGASEFTMDKDGRSPLTFKDRKSQSLMNELLQYQLLQDFRDPEPDPFSVPMPIPIIGYLLNCNHVHHHHHHRSGPFSQKLAVLPSPQSPAHHHHHSMEDVKMSKVMSKSATFASHLASWPETVRAKFTGRTYSNALQSGYYQVPTDDDLDCLDAFSYGDDCFDTGSENDDLLNGRDLKKSSSCVIQ